MKRLVLPLFLAVALTTVAVPVQADSGPNQEQIGRSVSCANEDGYANLVGVVAPSVQPTVNRAYKLATQTQVVDVDPGTGFEAWAESGDEVVVNFYDDENSLTHPRTPNTVPRDAAWGSVCVVLEKTPVRKWIPNPATSFHYQDGFPASS